MSPTVSLTYLYTPDLALDLPACFSDGRDGMRAGTQFTWADGRVRASLEPGDLTFLLDLRPASDADRRRAVNRAGWAYHKPR